MRIKTNRVIMMVNPQDLKALWRLSDLLYPREFNRIYNDLLISARDEVKAILTYDEIYKQNLANARYAKEHGKELVILKEECIKVPVVGLKRRRRNPMR